MYYSSPIYRCNNIKISNKVVKTFREREIYLDDKSISYEQIYGSEREYLEGESLTKKNFIFKNKDEKEDKLSEKISKEIIKEFEKKINNQKISLTDISLLERSAYIYTNSQPISLKYKINSEHSTKRIYIKKPSIMRIFGKEIYPLIAGYSKNFSDKSTFPFLLNKKTFIEGEMPGKLLDEINNSENYKKNVRYVPLEHRFEKKIIDENSNRSLKYLTGLIKTSVHSEFLSLFPDVLSEENRFIKGLETLLFDFNILFDTSPQKNYLYFIDLAKKYNRLGLLEKLEKMSEREIKNPFLFGYKHVFCKGEYYNLFCNEYTNKIISSEKKEIVKRIKNNEKKFFKFVEIFGEIKQEYLDNPFDETSKKLKSINDFVKENYNFKNLEEYFKKTMKEYSLLK